MHELNPKLSTNHIFDNMPRVSNLVDSNTQMAQEIIPYILRYAVGLLCIPLQ